jgi:Transposase DDE domain
MTKNVNILLINFLRAFITSNMVIDSFRAKVTDFTRERKLPFWITTVLILTSWKKSIHNRLNLFFTHLDLVAGMPEASAFCQARKKIKPELFITLKNETVKFFYDLYEKEGLVKRWKGRILCAIDGSIFNIPDTEETRKKYCIQTNQCKEGTVQALSSFLYDVLNEVCINAVINDKKSEKSFIFSDHAKKFTKEAIIIYDRLYADYSVISFHVKGDFDFVIRCPLTSSFKEVSNFVKSDCFDKIVTLKVTTKQKKFVKENGLPEVVTVRLVKVILSNGTIEVLITSLLDGMTYKLEDFKWLYNKRWCIETCFSRLKNLLEIERFSTKTVIGIEQDFHSLVFLSTLESILIKEDEEKIVKENIEKKRKYEYKINKSVSYTALADHIVDLLLNPDVPPSKVLNKMSRLFKNGSSPQRPGRQFKRKERTSTQKLRFHKYEKRVCA